MASTVYERETCGAAIPNAKDVMVLARVLFLIPIGPDREGIEGRGEGCYSAYYLYIKSRNGKYYPILTKQVLQPLIAQNKPSSGVTRNLIVFVKMEE